MPKQSLYNHFQKWNEDYYIAYNACSGAVALMTPEHYRIYCCLMEKISNGQSDGFNEEEDKLLKQLEYGKYTCPRNFDETRAIQFQSNIARYNVSSVALVIAPTMACNMACEYCYEATKSGKLDEARTKAIVEFVENRVAAMNDLSVTWYGGEPLLAMDVIEELSARFIELSEKHHFRYNASIITNGYLLSPRVIERLLELKVHLAQVTLDGPSEMHNKKRPLKNGKDSFATIVENLKCAAERMRLSVRVNIDKSFSTDTIDRLLDELAAAGLKEHVSVNFGHLDTATQVCANIAESCFDVSAFSEVETDYYRLLLNRGFRIDRVPSPSAVACMAQTLDAFVVDPNGEMYKCWNYVGDQAKSMGNIKDAVDYQHPNFLRLYDIDPFNYETCRECNILPVCMGACPSKRVDRDLSVDQVCESWKYNLEPMLEIIAASKHQEMLRAQEKAKAQENPNAQKSAEEKT